MIECGASDVSKQRRVASMSDVSVTLCSWLITGGGSQPRTGLHCRTAGRKINRLYLIVWQSLRLNFLYYRSVGPHVELFFNITFNKQECELFCEQGAELSKRV